MIYSARRTSSTQDGVVLGITAVLATAVFLFLLILGVDTVMVQREAQVLRLLTDHICYTVANSEGPPVQRTAATVFRNQVGLAQTDLYLKARISKAYLTIPTMPDPSVAGVPYTPDASKQPLGIKLKDLLESGCSLEGGEDCYYYSFPEQTTPTDSIVKSLYPSAFWSSESQAGMTVGCYLEAKASSWLSGERTIVANSVWRIPITSEDQPSPGLTIAIAPHLTTQVSDPRMRFSQEYSTAMREAVDPLLNFDSDPIMGFTNTNSEKSLQYKVPLEPGKIESFTIQYPIGPLSSTSAGNPEGGSLFSIPRSVPTNQDEYDESTDATFSDREELLTACMNPLVLMRNVFVSTIVELASRHAQLKTQTEVLLVGTEDQTTGRAPQEMVPWGSSLTEQGYQLPFVVYDTAEDDGGAVRPFDLAAEPAPPTQSLEPYRALASEQLRICYHLYHEGVSSRALTRLSVSELNNSNFEANGQIDPYYFDPSLLETDYGTPKKWQQECPWREWGNTCEDEDESRKLRAAELTGILGSIQTCPYAATKEVAMVSIPGKLKDDPPQLVPLRTPCNKPTLSDDLRADWAAFMNYLQGTLGSVPSPGAFPGSYDTLSNVPSINQTDVLLVLHKPVTPSEVLILRPLTAVNGPLGGRRFTIVYLPSTYADRDLVTLINLAFSIDSNRNNVVYTYAPTGQATPEWQQFRNYWLERLTTSEGGIVDKAFTVFFTRFVTREVKF